MPSRHFCRCVVVGHAGAGASLAPRPVWRFCSAPARDSARLTSASLHASSSGLAAAHSTALSWQDTDWDRIVGRYDLLGSATASPVVALNRAVAVTERDGPEAGLAALKTIAGLEYSHLWHAALADNLCRPGRTSDAAGELHTAVTLAPSEAEQRLLQGRLHKMRSELG